MVFCTSGEEGLQLMKEAEEKDEAFDIVLSDMHMPGMNGAEVAAAIVEEYTDRPVLILLSSVDLENRNAAGAAAISLWARTPVVRPRQRLATAGTWCAKARCGHI